MDEKQRKKQPRDPVYFVTRAQVVICLLVGLAVFGVSKASPAAKAALMRDYEKIAAMEIDVQDAMQRIESVWKTAPPAPSDTEAVTGTEGIAPTQPQGDADESRATDAPAASTQAVPDTTDALSEPSTQPASEAPSTRNMKQDADAPTARTMAQPVLSELVQPVSGGRYTSYFGDRMNPITHERAFHTGLDIAVPEGTVIRAAYDGTVRKCGEDDRAGKYVIVTHTDTTETFYCHCSAILVEAGDAVSAGDAIAKVGQTGWATGPHLHFEVRENGERVDPLPILTGDDD